MKNNRIFHAWIMLLLLSLGSTLAAFGIDRSAQAEPRAWITATAGAAILLLALLKGRLILAAYLGLDATRFWRRGFSFSLGLFVLVLLGLYLSARP